MNEELRKELSNEEQEMLSNAEAQEEWYEASDYDANTAVKNVKTLLETVATLRAECSDCAKVELVADHACASERERCAMFIIDATKEVDPVIAWWGESLAAAIRKSLDD